MRTTGWLLILVCATLLRVWAQEGGEGSAASAVRVLEHAWHEGESRVDNHLLDLILDNALVYIEEGRLVSKGECLSRIKLAGPYRQQVVLQTMTVRTFGSTAIVVGTYREKSVKDGGTLPTHWRFIDTWVN
jgi:hypothetical protein